jgi:hypothetical protein
MTATEVPAEMHASEVAASEATEMTKASKVTEAAEVTDPPKVTAAETAEMSAAAESTVPKGNSFTHQARHHARRERCFEAEPECHYRCENFRHPTSHGALLSRRFGTMMHTQPTRGRFRAFHGT